MHSTRRAFLKQSSAFAFTPFLTPYLDLLNNPQRKFKLCLNPGSIGVSADQNTLLQLAIKHGFEAITSMPEQLGEFTDQELQHFLADMQTHGISWGSAGLPVDFRKDENTFQNGLSALPRFAKALERAGATRMNTWIMPTHDTLTYRKNFQIHSTRLGMCASILADHGIRLGLEYVGPKTLMARSRYPFMRSMAEARELIATIYSNNVGLVLDSFHWYCAEDTIEDVLTLQNKDIITVDLNDARSDLSRDEQIDGTRELPLATGVINLKGFLTALIEIGYDGPVRAEPFNQPLRDMEDEEAIKKTYEAMNATLNLVSG